MTEWHQCSGLKEIYILAKYKSFSPILDVHCRKEEKRLLQKKITQSSELNKSRRWNAVYSKQNTCRSESPHYSVTFTKNNNIIIIIFILKIKLHILKVTIINSKNYLHIISKNYSVTKKVLKPVSVDSRDRDLRIAKIVPHVLFLR